MKSSSYAKTLNSYVADKEPDKLKDQLLVCALIMKLGHVKGFPALVPFVPDKI